MGPLAGKVAIVTGAGSGIGRACAVHFAEEGAKVIVADWNEGAGLETQDVIRGNTGDALFCHVDVSKGSEVEAMVQATLDSYGRLDTIVNNAAVQFLGPLTETTEEEWDLMHNVNLKGVFLCCKYAIPAMISSGGGSVVNMASILGFVGDPDLAAYGAFKGGVIALTKGTALAYGPENIRVNCICPGDVDTPMVQAYFNKAPDPQAFREEVSSKYALRRIATPLEVAKTAAFLASDASSFTTGGLLVVDGGVTSMCY